MAAGHELPPRFNKLVFLSSHLLAEVEQLCTRVGVVDGGRLVLQEQLSTLQAPTGRTIVHTDDADAAHSLLNGRVAERNGNRLVVAEADPATVNALLVSHGLRVSALSVERLRLEDIVLAVTEPRSDRRPS